ncbi:Receptor-like protein [Vigna angularis]|uniref:Receptor-like protein n=1 Tax=Phaseolus angularis TaxID=3914 RepID=A0A8T0KXP6_PHAAN|nr:Receptor-like protein [Vigna angularis]
MGTACTPTASETILLLLLLWFLSFLSTADDIYHPTDLFSISCGSSTDFSTPDARNWTSDIHFLSPTNLSVSAPSLTQSTIQGPYTHARLSHSPFTYSFPLTPGPKFIRLFFYSTSYQNFPRSQASFSVRAGPYTLLQDFNASRNADADDDPSHPDILFKEYCINLQDGDKLNITFLPSTTDSYAFINGIEIVSMPPYLYYTDPDDSTEQPQYVGTMTPYVIENKFALETMYRLKASEHAISSSEDTGMLRTWDGDSKYLDTQSEESLEYKGTTKLSFTKKTPNYTAPDQVFRSVRNMGRDASFNMRNNITWQLTVDSGFSYLLRLYFCELNPRVDEAGVLRFFIFIHDQLATDWADVFMWTKQWGVPVVKEYVVIISENPKRVVSLDRIRTIVHKLRWYPIKGQTRTAEPPEKPSPP